MYIYIHVPFCSHICSYCDFPKLLYDKKYISTYLKALTKEIETRYQNEEVVSIFIGGGTPTSLDIEELKQLLEITKLFHKQEKIEFTVESNVENLTSEKIKLLHDYGVNRVSLGVQSFQENTLKELNRHHTNQEVFQVIDMLKQEGITNISIDYIYGVNSNLEALKEDLMTFLQLGIPHISCYSLIIEEGTVFGINQRPYIDEDLEYQMYKQIETTLTKNHYIHYEISNYALPGYESIHNLNYWNNGSYYGFGLGAVSFIHNVRITNTRSITKYMNLEYVINEEYESEQIRISNEFILGLRKIEGMNIESFQKKYHQDITTLYHVKELLQEKKLILEDNYLKIAPEYLYLSNEILLQFV